jgi:hypothetical protein
MPPSSSENYPTDVSDLTPPEMEREYADDIHEASEAGEVLLPSEVLSEGETRFLGSTAVEATQRGGEANATLPPPPEPLARVEAPSPHPQYTEAPPVPPPPLMDSIISGRNPKIDTDGQQSRRDVEEVSGREAVFTSGDYVPSKMPVTGESDPITLNEKNRPEAVVYSPENFPLSAEEFVDQIAEGSLGEIAKLESYEIALSGAFALVQTEGGGLEVEKNDGYQLKEANEFLAAAGAEEPVMDTDNRSALGFTKPWDTGADYDSLVAEKGSERAKFYLSMNLETPEQIEEAGQFLTAVYERAKENGVSIMTKSESNAYDSCNIYSFEPEGMAEIIADLYEESSEMWNSVEHPLQGSVGAVKQEHVGYVQEPIGGDSKGRSHSARAAAIGRQIDGLLVEAGSDDLSADIFRNACEREGVNPDKPYELAA